MQIKNFPFANPANRTISTCDLRIPMRLNLSNYLTPVGIVIATERPDNPGMSITNACADLAGQVCEVFSLSAVSLEKLLWIEEYDGEFSIVHLEYTGHYYRFPSLRKRDGYFRIPKFEVMGWEYINRAAVKGILQIDQTSDKSDRSFFVSHLEAMKPIWVSAPVAEIPTIEGAELCEK